MHASAADHEGRRAALRRIAAAALLLGTLVALAAATGSLPSPDEARDWGERLGPLAALAYVPLFVLVNFVVAWAILAGAAGLLFGVAAGTPLALAGVTAAALAQMALARRLAGSHAGRLLPPRTRALEGFLERNGAVAVMQARIVPLLPFALVNYSAGLTRLSFRDMALGTAVGGIPKAFVYVSLGGNLTRLGSPEAIAGIAVAVAIGLAGTLLVRRRLAAERAAAAA